MRLTGSSTSYHGRNFTISLKELDDFALVSGLDPSKQTSIAHGSCLVAGTQVVEFATRKRFALGRFSFGKHANTSANSLGCGLEQLKRNNNSWTAIIEKIMTPEGSSQLPPTHRYIFFGKLHIILCVWQTFITINMTGSLMRLCDRICDRISNKLFNVLHFLPTAPHTVITGLTVCKYTHTRIYILGMYRETVMLYQL